MTRRDTRDNGRPAAANRLQAAREAAGYGRTEACRLFGFNLNTYKSHEYGIRSFDRSDAERYARAFQCSADILLLGSPLSVPHSDKAVPSPASLAYHTQAADGTVAHGVGGTGFTMSHESSTASTSETETNRGTAERTISGSFGGTALGARQAGHGGLDSPSQTAVTAAAHGAVPVAGSLGFGIWLLPSSDRLHEPAAVPASPDHPYSGQYARQAMEPSPRGLFSKGDYLVLLRLSDGIPLPRNGIFHVARHRGDLVEHAIWTLSSGILTCETGAQGEAVSFRYDPEDPNVRIEGLLVAVYRQIVH